MTEAKDPLRKWVGSYNLQSILNQILKMILRINTCGWNLIGPTSSVLSTSIAPNNASTMGIG